MKKSFFILMLILLGCSSKETEVPPDVLPRQQMVRVLIDVHILEAKVKRLYLSNDSSQVLYDHYEKMLFDDLGITREEYDRSLDFYIDHISEFSSMYDEVQDSLLARTKSGDIN